MANEWRTAKLNELGSIITGRTPSFAEGFGDEIPFITPSDLGNQRIVSRTGRQLSAEGAKAVSKAVIPANAIMVSCIGSDMGKAALTDKPSVTNQQINSIVIDTDDSPLFIYYCLSTRKDEIRLKAGGSAQPIMNKTAFGQLSINLPGTETQRRIAHILGTLDDKIELNRQLNATLEQLARTLFQSWFVDFDPVRAKASGEPAGSICRRLGLTPELLALFPAELEESVMGEIPAGWSATTLGNYLSVLETGRRPKGGVSGITEGVPSIGAESIWGVGYYDYSKTKYVPKEFFEKMKSSYIESGDVLLYKDGGKPGDFQPRVSMFGEGFPFKICGINEHVFRLRSDVIGQPFLYFQIGHDKVLADLRHRGAKAAIPGINQSDVKAIKIVLPSDDILSAYNNYAAPILKTILSNALESRTLATLRDELLPKLLSGELSVAHQPLKQTKRELEKQTRIEWPELRETVEMDTL